MEEPEWEELTIGSEVPRKLGTRAAYRKCKEVAARLSLAFDEELTPRELPQDAIFQRQACKDSIDERIDSLIVMDDEMSEAMTVYSLDLWSWERSKLVKIVSNVEEGDGGCRYLATLDDGKRSLWIVWSEGSENSDITDNSSGENMRLNSSNLSFAIINTQSNEVQKAPLEFASDQQLRKIEIYDTGYIAMSSQTAIIGVFDRKKEDSRFLFGVDILTGKTKYQTILQRNEAVVGCDGHSLFLCHIFTCVVTRFNIDCGLVGARYDPVKVSETPRRLLSFIPIDSWTAVCLSPHHYTKGEDIEFEEIIHVNLILINRRRNKLKQVDSRSYFCKPGDVPEVLKVSPPLVMFHRIEKPKKSSSRLDANSLQIGEVRLLVVSKGKFISVSGGISTQDCSVSPLAWRFKDITSKKVVQLAALQIHNQFESCSKIRFISLNI